MKKIFSFVLIALVIVGLSACSTTGSSKSDATKQSPKSETATPTQEGDNTGQADKKTGNPL